MQEKEFIIHVRYRSTNRPSGHCLASRGREPRDSLVMPKNSDPWDRFVDPYLTLMSDSYILDVCNHSVLNKGVLFKILINVFTVIIWSKNTYKNQNQKLLNNYVESQG